VNGPSPAGPVPESVRVRMYQVGFGDCFLVSFGYEQALDGGGTDRHVLIDFGSNQLAPGTKLLDVAGLIADHSGGRLDAVVVSHRHRDHMQGFGNQDPAGVIGGLNPRLVVRPWTEDPDLPPDATGPTGGGQPPAGPGDGLAPPALIGGLSIGQRFAAELVEAIGETASSGLRADLKGLALNQLANQPALTNLEQWGKADGARAVFTSYGRASGIEDVVPGITVSVLGPPTVAEWPNVSHERASNDEYWEAYRRLLGEAVSVGALSSDAVAAGAALSAERPPAGDVGPVRWLVSRLDRQQLASFLRIVEYLDGAMNNTSLILLIQAGDRKLLFPGDAQIENWEFALKHAPDHDDVGELLRGVDLYKVGHHGSRNATPRSLFGLWDPAVPRGRRTGLMSTRTGVYPGHAGTEVPRQTLVEALQTRMTLLTTDDLPGDRRFIEVVADTSGQAGFEQVPPP
jgi:hypothetical protein